jgi:hypothetical protein
MIKNVVHFICGWITELNDNKKLISTVIYVKITVLEFTRK